MGGAGHQAQDVHEVEVEVLAKINRSSSAKYSRSFFPHHSTALHTPSSNTNTLGTPPLYSPIAKMQLSKFAVALSLLAGAVAGPLAKRAEGVHLVNCVKKGVTVFSQVVVSSPTPLMDLYLCTRV